MELLVALQRRRTARRFKQTPVEDSALLELVRAATLAPSGGNGQPLRYVVVRTPDLLKRVFDLTAWAAHVKPRRTPEWGKSSPVAFIAVCATKSDSGLLSAEAGAAIQNMQLRAMEFGLACCWLGAFDRRKAADIIGIGDMSCLFLLAVGHPDESPVMDVVEEGSSTKYWLDNDDVLHVPKFNPSSITDFK